MLRERIGIEKFDDTIWTERDDKLPVHITSKNMILITCVIRRGCKFNLNYFQKMHEQHQYWWKVDKMFLETGKMLVKVGGRQ